MTILVMVMTFKKIDKKLDDDFWKTKNLKISIGEVSEGKSIGSALDEPMGPTPKPSVTDLRSWVV